MAALHDGIWQIADAAREHDGLGDLADELDTRASSFENFGLGDIDPAQLSSDEFDQYALLHAEFLATGNVYVAFEAFSLFHRIGYRRHRG